MLLAAPLDTLLAGAGLSYYINTTGPHGGATNDASYVGLVIGCSILAVFIYWLARRLSPILCVGAVGLLAAAILGSRGGAESTPSGKKAKPTATVRSAAPAGPKPSREALCAQNVLCARCRQTFGPSGDCYGYLSQPPQTLAKDCGCNGDLTCLMNCSTF